MSDAPVRVRDMPHEEMRRMLRVLGPEIGQLAKRGDKLARALMQRYQYAFDHPADLTANRELRIAFDDYVSRDLRTAEQYELGSRFGHRLEETPAPLRVFVPGTDKRH